MRDNWRKIALLSLGLASTLALSACAANDKHAAGKQEDEGDEIKMKIDDVPPPVKATITREAEGAAVANVDKEMDEGKTIYEADAMISGTNYEIRVADDGSLISKKIDAEEKSSSDESPDKKKDKD